MADGSSNYHGGGFRGAGGPGPPIFGKVSFIFLHCIQCLKKYF